MIGPLALLVLLPIVGAIVLSLLPADNKLARLVGLGFTGLAFLASVGILLGFKSSTFHFSASKRATPWVSSLGIGLHLGVRRDSRSWLLVLTTFLSLMLDGVRAIRQRFERRRSSP